MNYEFENGDDPLRVSAGHGLLLPDGAGHRGRADESGVRLFLIDRAGIVRWNFTEVLEDGLNTFRALNPEELMSAASRVAH